MHRKRLTFQIAHLAFSSNSTEKQLFDEIKYTLTFQLVILADISLYKRMSKLPTYLYRAIREQDLILFAVRW